MMSVMAVMGAPWRIEPFGAGFSRFALGRKRGVLAGTVYRLQKAIRPSHSDAGRASGARPPKSGVVKQGHVDRDMNSH
jgi:hypothetical protein